MDSDALGSKKTSRSHRPNTDPNDSLRSPVCKKQKESWEALPSAVLPRSAHRIRARGTRGNRSAGSRISKSQVAQKPTLGQFAPVLVAKFGSQDEKFANGIHTRYGSATTLPAAVQRSLHVHGRARNQPYHYGRGSQRLVTEASRQPLNHVQSSKYDDPDEIEPVCDSRARKCLWADEIDEAFVDDDGVDTVQADGTSPHKKSEEAGTEAREPLTEKQLTRRQKDIDIGRGTEGYKSYVHRIPKDKRGNLCPQTPDKLAPISRRSWDAMIHRWRINLHNWDKPCLGAVDKHSKPTMISPRKISIVPRSSRTPRKLPSPKTPPTGPATPGTPGSGIFSSPIDHGYGTPAPGQLCDDEFVLPLNEFPALPGSKAVGSSISVAKMSWAEAMSESERKEQEKENKRTEQAAEASSLSQIVERQLSLNSTE